jgi:hypothetical protein
MRVIVLLLLVGVAFGAPLRGLHEFRLAVEQGERGPAFPFHTYEAIVQEAFDGSEKSSYVSMLPESMFVEVGTATGGAGGAGTGGAGAAAAATGSASGGTGATGATAGTGNTGATGATGATGEESATASEGPVENKDKVMTAQIALAGMTVEQFSEPAKATFLATLAKFLGVPKNNVMISGIKSTGDAAAAGETALLEVLEGTGAIAVEVQIVEITATKATGMTQKLNKEIASLATTLQSSGVGAFATLSGAVLAAPVSVGSVGAGAAGGCADKVLEQIAKVKISGGKGEDLPARLKEFCKQSFEAKKDKLRIDAKVITSTCQDAYHVIENVKVEDRLGKPLETSKKFCKHMRSFFEKVIANLGAGPMSIGMASSVTEINKESPGNGITSCCVQHGSPGCYDQAIQKCVCEGVLAGGKPSKFGKVDKHCCTNNWDLTCAENVEWFHCAGCPQEALFR